MITANHPFAVRSLNVWDENGLEGCATCGRARSVHPASAPVAPPAGTAPDDTRVPRLCPSCLHDGVLERALDRAGAAEAKLASLRAVLLEGGQDAGTARRRALAIIGSEEEDRG